MVTDQTKRMYDALSAAEGSGGWAQTSYPAVVQYRKQKRRLTQITKKILIEVLQGTTAVQSYGQTSADPKHWKPIVHVFITYQDPQKSVLQNEQYLQTLLGAFETWFAAQAFTDVEIIEVFSNVNDGTYELDIWLKMYEMS